MRVGLEAWLATANPKQRVGLLSHQAALLSTGETAAQAMYRHFGKNFVALFGPEHGYFGRAAAGEKTFSVRHQTWDIPVYSLYGDERKPTPEMLQGIDTLVIDLQDIGVRCYTYLATLKLALEACQENNVQCVICERPIPLYGIQSGPVAEPEHFSFVAPCALPLVYGMTHTELAAWFQYPHIPAPMEGCERSHERPLDAPEFLPPSPAIRSWQTARIYPSMVFAEALPQLDIGRTTPYAFRILSAPWIQGEELARELNRIDLPGVYVYDFTQNDDKGAIRLHLHDFEAYDPWTVTRQLLTTLERLYGPEHLFLHPEARPQWMTQLCGGTMWQQGLTLPSPTP
jgi:beta-N-acetylhexosaminidase